MYRQTFLRLATALAVGFLVADSAWRSSVVLGEEAVRRYPDPGYRRLGVYAGGPQSHFDYRLVKLFVDRDVFPHKREFWAGLKKQSENAPETCRHDVYLIFCGERTGAGLDVVKRRVDAWLKPEQDVPTYPELIPAICLSEENTPKADAVLDGLARHVREQYRIPVFQWYSDPLSPSVTLTADGWIWDSYDRPAVQFRKHLMEFVALGKPAICVPWASDPHWPGWKQSPDTQTMVNREWHQFGTCMEFNVSCAVFAVAGPHGSVGRWTGVDTPDMVILRNCLATKRAEMHALGEKDLPLASANFSARDRGVAVGGDDDAPSVYEEDFDGFRWIHDANIRGFLDLKLTSRPEEPGFLLTRTAAGREVQTSLVYRFESYFPLKRVRVVLDGAAPGAAQCRNVIALGTDELSNQWGPSAEQADCDTIERVELAADEDFLKGRRVFFLRVQMENNAAAEALPGNRLDRLRVECVHRPPPAGASATLVADDYGHLSYEDDFSTSRWRHLGQLEVAHKGHGGYRNGEFWVGMVGRSATRTHLVERVSSPRPLKTLTVTADCSADQKNLGGRVRLQVAPRGGKPTSEASTSGIHRGPLRLEVPKEALDGLQEFDVHVVLEGTSGVEHE